MAPQVWAEQLRAGAWGITVATVRQLEVAVSFAVPRVLVANEVVGSHDLESLVAMLSTGETELFAFVDSVRGAALLAERLNPANAPALGVFVELGLEGGRCGIRTDEELDDVVAALGGLPRRCASSASPGSRGSSTSPTEPPSTASSFA